jgi:hypothetical protein
MHRHTTLLMAGVLLFGLSPRVLAQLQSQSPRQAMVEMFSGSEQKFQQHLTPEVQNKLQDFLKNSAAPQNALQRLSRPANGEKFDAFDSGPILFAINDAQQHQRYELRVESDELRGDEDLMELSLHSLRSGVEEEMPVQIRFQLGLKLQESVWRLSTLTVSAKLPVGDPRILEQSFWLPQIFGGATKSMNEKPQDSERPVLSPMRAVRRIAVAETLYAQRHPHTGFSCALADLINVGKGLDEVGPYRILDAQLGTGTYNGYRFYLRGCHGIPARSFEVIGEPLSGIGKAYCSDDHQNLRSSDDGRGLTCLASGKVARQ